MKVITLWEPWASLMAAGAKKIETRSWSSGYCGPVAIHAALGGLCPGEFEDTCNLEFFRERLSESVEGVREWFRSPYPTQSLRSLFPCGKIIAVGELVNCMSVGDIFDEPDFLGYPALDTAQERAFGNYEAGRYGFVFEDVKPLAAPVPWKSRQGKLLDLSAATEQQVLARLHHPAKAAH